MYSGKGATQAQELGYLPGEQGFLKPAEWHDRAPFFCRLTADDMVLKFRTSEAWAVEIKRGISPVLKPGFFSTLEDGAPDKAFVVDGGEETHCLPGRNDSTTVRPLGALSSPAPPQTSPGCLA